MNTRDQREKEIADYRTLLEELEKWLLEIKQTLTTDINKENVEENLQIHQVCELTNIWQ